VEINRKPTKPVPVGKLVIGGGAPISVQSMTKTDTRDVVATVRQIKRLAQAGCELVRVAVLDEAGAKAIAKIKKAITIPLVADIHFNYRLALASIRAGADKLRINPGNIGEDWKLAEVIKACQDKNLPIRIGINTGSLDKAVLRDFGRPTPAAIIASLEKALTVFEKNRFTNIVISAKASDVATTVDAYRLISQRFEYPLHLGLTESGLPLTGAVRSTAALALLLSEGIGDTIRVSLTGDPVLEVKVGYEILKSLGLREYGPTLVSCPTCGRCEIDLVRLAKQAAARLKKVRSPMRVAIMGCVVNGPGEAREADYGIAGGRGTGLIFKKGKIIKKVKADRLLDALFELIAID
jgi:(E)-4-hydroxy-3-methylbut-2-enyl-diphosphate synthase